MKIIVGILFKVCMVCSKFISLLDTSRSEKNYVEKIKLKEAENIKDGKLEQTPTVGSEGKGTSLKSKISSSSAEQDLDTFLLGDLEDSDVEPAGTLDRQLREE